MIDGTDHEPLELTQEVGFADEPQEELAPEEEVVVSFGDEPEEGVEETPLIKQLRDQNRQQARELKRLRGSPPSNDADPEPTIPEEPELEAFDYDPDKFKEANRAREKALLAHMDWKQRNAERTAAQQRAADEQAKQTEQQKRALGVTDFETRAATVKDRLTEQQLAVLINASDNPAKMLYALGRSETRLEELAGIDNLAKFAARAGQMEKDIRVSKKTAPAPESRVRGATASTAVTGSDKELAKLEAEAAKTGDRSKLAAYRRANGIKA